MNQIIEYNNSDFENSNIMVMDEIPEYNKEDYDLFNEKDFKHYIDDIETIVRSSREYKTFIQYLRQYMDMNTSLFLQNVNNIETAKIKIELHHTPFTLYDIALTVFNKRQRLQEPLDVELVAKEVCYIHYFLCIGLIPLSRTEHKLVHNQALFVPIDKVLGNYEKFIEMYEQDIPQDAMDRYNTYKDLTEKYNHAINTNVLQINPTYLKLPGSDENSLGAYSLPLLQQVLESTQNMVSSKKSEYIEDKKYDNNKKKIRPFMVEEES